MKYLNVWLVTSLILISPQSYAAPTVKLTLHVIDERGLPISGAKAGMGFLLTNPKGPGTLDGKPSRGITDGNGKFTGSGESGKYVSYGAVKDGYYHSRYTFTKFTDISGFIGFRRWQPWNPTMGIVLKEIKKPIALYAKRTGSMDIPIIDRYIGYDLKKGDWVSPYGKGFVSDFLFKLEKSFQGRRDYSATLFLRFSNPSDGIVSVYQKQREGSELRLSHEAPTSGYQNKLDQSLYSKPNEVLKPFYRDDQNYFFRVRSEVDDQGNIINAIYGKIHGNIEYWDFHEETGTIKFTYYLNPSINDRNLEFDPKKNLFKGIKNTHDVVDP